MVPRPSCGAGRYSLYLGRAHTHHLASNLMLGNRDGGPTCELLGFESLVLQGFLGAMAVLLLVLKRKHEYPRRPWKIWYFDVGKQVIGALIMHFLNVLGSILLSGEDVPDMDDNPCTWYFLNILFDTTIGVPILFFTLYYVYAVADKLKMQDIMSGEYGSSPRYTPFLKQLALYIVALFLAKIILSLVLYYVPFLDDWGAYLISWTDFDARLQIAFVMLVFPTVMNSIQYYAVDSIIQSPEFGTESARADERRLSSFINYSTFKQNSPTRTHEEP